MNPYNWHLGVEETVGKEDVATCHPFCPQVPRHAFQCLTPQESRAGVQTKRLPSSSSGTCRKEKAVLRSTGGTSLPCPP